MCIVRVIKDSYVSRDVKR